MFISRLFEKINILLSLFVSAMCRQLEQMKKERERSRLSSTSSTVPGASSPRQRGGDVDKDHRPHGESYECVALHVSPDLGERIMLSGDRALLDEVFPETNQALMDARSSVAWNQHDTRHVIRFPLNGYCKLNSVQAVTRLLNAGFRVAASNGGGVEGQQFSEYLFVRKV